MKLKRLVIDANVLLLLVAGRIDPRLINSLGRLRNRGYGPDEFDLLASVVGDAEEAGTTPHAWTEVANLIFDDKMRRPARSAVSWVLKQEIEERIEIYVSSSEATKHAAFQSLGLTDTTLLLALDNNATLITADLPLYEYACGAGHGAINFDHLRENCGLV